jgi:adenosine deaminase
MIACLDEPDLRWFERLPKVELHLHLEGAIPHDVLWELLSKYGGDLAMADFQLPAPKFVQ